MAASLLMALILEGDTLSLLYSFTATSCPPNDSHLAEYTVLSLQQVRTASLHRRAGPYQKVRLVSLAQAILERVRLVSRWMALLRNPD